MMLNINFEQFRAGFIHYLPIGVFIASLLFVEIGSLLYLSFDSAIALVAPATLIPDPEKVTNAAAIGQVLYTKYLLLFQLSGVVLLVAMIGAIVLTLRHRTGVKRQRIYKQISRKRSDAVEVVSVQSGEGV